VNNKLSLNEKNFLIILVFVHLIFFIYAVTWGNIYVGDFREYLRQSLNLKEHLNWYTEVFKEPYQMDFYSRRPPMYAAFILSVKSIYDSDYLVLFFQSVLSCFNFFGLIKLLKSYRFSFNILPLLLLFIFFYPAQFIYSNFIMSEILFQTLLFWAFYNFNRFIKTKESKFIVFYNLLISFAILTKPVLYLFWIVNLLLMIYLFFKNKKSTAPVFTGLIPLAIVLLICFYNYNVTGYFHYSSLKQNNLLEFHSNYLLINKEGYEKSISEYEKNIASIDSIKDYTAKSKAKERIAINYIKENFSDYLYLNLKGVLNFFLDPGRFEFSEFFKIKSPHEVGIYYVYLRDGYEGIIKYILKLPLIFILFLICIMIINIIMIFSIVNFIFEKRVEAAIRIYFIVITAYLCVLTGIVGSMRYKLPLVPMILFSIPFLFDKVKSILNKNKTGVN
jgi:hypothetical protein